MTLDDLERPIRTLAEKMRFTESPEKKLAISSETLDRIHDMYTVLRMCVKYLAR